MSTLKQYLTSRQSGYLTFRYSGLLRTTIPIDLIEAVVERADGTCKISLTTGQDHVSADTYTQIINRIYDHQTKE